MKEDKKKVFIRTLGCQMNEFETEVASGILRKHGYGFTEDEEEAEIILFNTCSVRRHAEERVLGQLEELKLAKKKRPGLLIGVMGCMVENYKAELLARYPHLDFLVGPRSIHDLPKVIEQARSEKRQIAELKRSGFGYELSETGRIDGKIHAYLPIMTGCSKVCSYCVVPYVRGPEVSRPAQEILDEVKRLRDMGIKHITLLGQNVNSYGQSLRGAVETLPKQSGEMSFPNALIWNLDSRSFDFAQDAEHVEALKHSGMTEFQNNPSFANLLRALCQINGIEKIGFMTSHPEDASEELFRAIRDEAKISRHFHLPLQSGSDNILKGMRRDHTFEDYQKKIRRLRELVPEISVTTDIIAGFPGEGKKEYEETKRALEEIEFDSAFIFRYSPRPHTAAARWEDTVPEKEKTRRVNELLALQKTISRRRNESLIGKTFRAMIADRSKKRRDEVLARNWQEKKIVFKSEPSSIGKIVDVKLIELLGETFRGELICHCESRQGRGNHRAGVEIASVSPAEIPRNDGPTRTS